MRRFRKAGAYCADHEAIGQWRPALHQCERSGNGFRSGGDTPKSV